MTQLDELEKTVSITEVTRRDIFDFLRVKKINWCGRLEEIDFLNRVFNLSSLPSQDSRFPNMEGDIWQHRVMNPYDWDDDWVYSDDRLNLHRGPDEVFLRFLCELVHPVVLPDDKQCREFVNQFNKFLSGDEWMIVETTKISGHPVFGARKRLHSERFSIQATKQLADIIDADYINTQVTRLEASIEADPELAIGTSKELIEAVCKTVLSERKVDAKEARSLPQLVRIACKELKLAPDSIPEEATAADTIRKLLMNLATISDGMASLRNYYGTGHGKQIDSKGLGTRHARLAVNCAVALATFIYETHREKPPPL